MLYNYFLFVGNNMKLSTFNLIKENQKDQIYFDRELSWLSFNERVLNTSLDPLMPIGERLNFISISSDNLDEFCMVRLAGILQLIERGYKIFPETNNRIDELLEEIINRRSKLLKNQEIILKKTLFELKEKKIEIVNKENLGVFEKKWLRNWYKDKFLKLLSPITLDPNHPFPFIQNQGKAIFLEMKSPKNKVLKSVISIPENFDRFILLPGKNMRFVLVEEIIILFIDFFYPNHKVENSCFFRVLRDSEIDIDDEAEDLVSQFETALKARRRGDVVSAEFCGRLSKKSIDFIQNEWNLSQNQIYFSRDYVGIGDFVDLLNFFPKKWFFKHFQPRFPQRIVDFKGDCFAAIKNKDILIHHPYESFDVVVKFLEQAAIDPNVLSIRQTLYRTTPESPITKALILAAENGKSVTALIELKARFDEENNLQLARLLEKAGAQVAYGLAELKVHSKLSFVVRKENKKLIAYSHCGTGNYHPVNAKIYTDLSFFTCNREICEDIWKVFNYLTSYVEPKELNKIILSPNDSHAWLIAMIENEIANSKSGKVSGIWIKCNALVEENIINKFYEASQSGVKIHLIIRGICCLRPGIKGLSENISVTSIIGRFLEHGRIYVFANGGNFMSEKNLVYMASADLMPRNLFRRVENFIPLENETVREQALTQVMYVSLEDNKNKWVLDSKGKYTKVLSNKNKFSSHDYFMKNPSLSGQGTLAEKAKKTALQFLKS